MKRVVLLESEISYNRKSEDQHVDKFLAVLANTRMQVEEKEGFIRYFDTAEARAKEEMRKRAELAIALNEVKFRERFPYEV